MPELPEVETVRRNLSANLKSKVIEAVDIFHPKIITKEIARTLYEQKVWDVKRHGKYLVFVLDDIVAVAHLRMEGRFHILNSWDAPHEKHAMMRIMFEDKTSLDYIDTRKFGTFKTFPRAVYEANPYKIIRIAPDANTSWDVSTFHKKLSKIRKSIKTTLLDQTVIGGIGNIYVDEILFASQINPNTLACQLSVDQADKVLQNSKQILNHAVELKGSSIKTYSFNNVDKGSYQQFLKVHTKKDQPCSECGEKIIKIKVNGRGTYFCRLCQPLVKINS